MDLKRIQEFCVFSKHLNFTTAAKELYISQPSLSAHIAELESELGFLLVSRAKQKNLTEAGEIFLSGSQRLLEGYEDMLKRCSEAAVRSRKLRFQNESPFVGMLPLIEEGRRRMQERHRIDVRYSLESISNTPFVEALKAGMVDFAFYFCGGDQASSVKLLHDLGLAYVRMPAEPCVLLMSSDNPLAKQNTVLLDDIGASTLLFPSDVAEDPFQNAVMGSLTLNGLNLTRRRLPIDATFGWRTVEIGNDLVPMSAKAYRSLSALDQLTGMVLCDVEGLNLFVTPYLVYESAAANANVALFATELGDYLETLGLYDATV